MNLKLKLKNVTVPQNEINISKSHLYKQYLGTFGSCLISLCSGITFGITAVMLPQLREDKSIKYDTYYDSWIASSASLAMVFGSLGCGPILDKFGRKAAHIILGIPSVIGWIFIACANSTEFILIGRVFTGIATGANKAVTLVYIGEIANPTFRSAALFLPGLVGHCGILFSHIIGHCLHWKTSAIVCILPAILSLITFLFLKESPLWLIAKGRTEEGIETFRWFRGTDESSESELKLVLQRQTEKPAMSAKEMLHAVCAMSFVKPMLILIVLMLNVQFSGVNVLIFYSQDVFEDGFSKNVDAFLLIMVMDCIRVIVAIFICLLGKLVPKKISLIISTFAVSVFVFGLVACLLMDVKSAWLRISCLILYIAFSSAIVTIGWTFVPELLPNHLRGFGSGINSTFSYFALFVLVKVTPDLMHTYGTQALFGVFGVSTVVTGLILVLFLPETNGKTLQFIEDSYKTNESKVEITPL